MDSLDLRETDIDLHVESDTPGHDLSIISQRAIV